MGKIFAIIIVVGLVLVVNFLNPKFEDHKFAISSEISVESENWEDLEYKDYFVVSFTKSFQKKTMVSFGFLNYIQVVNDEWTPQVE